MSIGQEIINRLEEFTNNLENNTILQKSRVTKIVKLENGDYKRVVSTPQIEENHTQDHQNNQ
jgi:hypothetical protein